MKQDTGISKLTAQANTHEDLKGHGCSWKVLGFICDCYNKNIGFRKQVWRMPSRDAVQKAGGHGDNKLYLFGLVPLTTNNSVGIQSVSSDKHGLPAVP